MKRFAALFLVLCLTLNAPVTAFAQTVDNSPVRIGEDATYVELPPVALEELVFSGATEQLNSLDAGGNVKLKDGNYVRYIDRIDIPDYAMNLYKMLEEGADGDGVDDILIDVTQAQSLQGSYVVLFAKFSGSYSSDEQLINTVYANLAEAGTYTWAVAGAFDRDHPEVFWLGGNWITLTSYSYSSESRTYTQSIYLLLSGTVNGQAYDIRLDGYTDPGTIKRAIAQRDNNVQAILNSMPSTAVSNADKMRYFNNWLTHNNEYNTAVSSGNSSAAGKMAWECISALQGSSGTEGPVCDGYARAFQVLCMKSGIPCVLVSGETLDINTGAKNAHIWNYVQLGNGWYGVDVTWNDPVGGDKGKVSGFEGEYYLFVGSSTVAVVGGKTFLAEHPVENNVFLGGVRFTNGPILNGTAYSSGDTHYHTYTSKVTKAATCTNSGTKTFTCSICGNTYTETIAKTAHKAVTDKAVAATCTKAGKTEGSHCSVCGTVIKAQTTVKATGHTLKTTTTKATASKAGKTVTACTVCGTTTKTVTIAKVSSISLSATSYTYDGSAKKPTVTVKDSNGKKLTSGTDYTVTYASGRKDPGSYTVKITLKGNYSGSKTLTFKILPKQVTSLKASSQTTSSVTLSWKKVTGATGYQVYKYDSSKKAYVKVKATSGTSYKVTGLKAGTTYKFKVRAYTKTGSSYVYGAYTSVLSASTKPAVVTNLKATKSGSTGVKLTWSKVTGATGYQIYKYDTAKKKYVKVKSTTGTSYTVTGLKSGAENKIKVRAYKKVGSSYLYGAFTWVPSTPTSLKASTQTTSSITLSWKKSTSATGYAIYQYNSSKKAYVKVATTTKNTYKISKLKAGATYKFKIRAYQKVGNITLYSDYSSVLSTSTKLSTPTLTVTSGSKKATLSWKKVSGASGYGLYMATSKNGTYKKIATIKSGSTVKYTKTGLTKGQTYYFKIRAYRTVSGKYFYSAYSSVKSVKVK